MSRMTKTLQSVKQGWKDQNEQLEASPDLSSIEKDSIFQDDQSQSDGNPFHSTALEDDFSPIQTQQKTTPVRKTGTRSVAERTETPRRVSSTLRRQSAAKQGKAKEKCPQNPSSAFKTPSVPALAARLLPKPTAITLRKISEESDTPETSESASTSQDPSATGRDSEETDREALTDAGSTHSPPARRRSQPVRRSQGQVASSSRQSNKKPEAGTQKQPRKSSGLVPLQKILEENEIPASAEDAETDSDSLMDEDSVYVPPSLKKRRSGQRSQEEDEEEEEEENSSINARGRKNAKGQKKSRSSSGSSRKSRKSSSSSRGAATGLKRRNRNVRNPIDLEVVLEAFQNFVEQYKETVDSNAVQRAIDHLSESFVEQLTEAITATKELTTVKKKNIKLNTAMNNKRSKLVDAKNELIQSEAKLRALEKEHKQLEQRVTDLTQSMTFLNGLTELHSKYLAHCEEHPEEDLTYNLTSLPALLLEARCMLGAEHQLQMVNAKLQQVLDSVNKK